MVLAILGRLNSRVIVENNCWNLVSESGQNMAQLVEVNSGAVTRADTFSWYNTKINSITLGVPEPESVLENFYFVYLGTGYSSLCYERRFWLCVSRAIEPRKGEFSKTSSPKPSLWVNFIERSETNFVLTCHWSFAFYLMSFCVAFHSVLLYHCC